MKTLIGALAIVLLVVAGAIGITVWQARKAVITWQPCPGDDGCRWRATFSGFDAGELVPAFQEAQAQLQEHTTDKAFPFVSFVIRPEESWTDQWGREVGGFTELAGPSSVVSTIGQSLDVICHELRHGQELTHRGAADVDHLQWADAGVWDADEAYRAWKEEHQ